ncbi:MAG: flippase-like domain-containing protein [Candidatus Eisenbacteria bacterium]|nr:flippase-like domain-containing protein [Candidatus Eisenbacteria bacterium]
MTHAWGSTPPGFATAPDMPLSIRRLRPELLWRLPGEGRRPLRRVLTSRWSRTLAAPDMLAEPPAGAEVSGAATDAASAPVAPSAGAARGSSRFWFWARLLVALTLAVVLISTVDSHAAIAALASTDLRLVGIVFGLAFVDRFIMAYKWNMLLRAQGRGFSTIEAYRIYLAAAFVGAWLPTGVGGDMFRAVRSSVSGRGVSTVSVTIFFERVLGLLAVSTLSAGALGILAMRGDSRTLDIFFVALALVVATLVGLAFSIHPRVFAWIKRITARWADRKPVQMFLSLHDAYLALSRHRAALTLFFLMSVFEQFLQVVMNWLAARALHLPVSLLDFTALVPISNVLVTLPISIAAVGVLEGTYVLVLARAGVPAAAALSLSLLMRAIGWVMLVPSGSAFMWDSATLKRRQAGEAL